MSISIQDLHKLAYTRFPKESCHQILHDAAAMKWHVQSLSECSPQQLDQLAAFVKDHPVREPLSTQHSALSTTPRPFRSTSRPRSGTPIAPGTIRLASPAQKGLIRRLFSEMRWTEDWANKWLVRYYGVATIDQIPTVQDASRIIQHLMRIKADKTTARR